jgi:hypothetical protein
MDIQTNLLNQYNQNHQINYDPHSLNQKILLLQKIGSPSYYGTIYTACYPIMKKTVQKIHYFFLKKKTQTWVCNDHSIQIAVKQIPITSKFYHQLKTKNLIDLIHTSKIATEIYILQFCSILVQNKISPNIPLFFDYYFCKDPLNLYLIQELASGDLKQWAQEASYPLHYWISLYLQIFIALYTLQIYGDIIHNDLHWGNILYQVLKPGGKWVYQLTKKDIIYVHNFGNLFLLCDFGESKIIKDHPFSFFESDYYRILHTPLWLYDHYNILVKDDVANLIKIIIECGQSSPNVLDFISSFYNHAFLTDYRNKTNIQKEITPKYIIGF